MSRYGINVEEYSLVGQPTLLASLARTRSPSMRGRQSIVVVKRVCMVVQTSSNFLSKDLTFVPVLKLLVLALAIRMLCLD